MTHIQKSNGLQSKGQKSPLGRKTLLGLIFAAGLLNACSHSLNSAEPVKPSGIDLSAMDTKVRPQDNFFDYVNGTWVANTAMPSDKTRWGAFDMLREKSQKDVRAIIEDVAKAPKGADEQKIADFYNSFMNEAAVEQAGLAPLQDALDSISQLASSQDILRNFAQAFVSGYDSPFNPWVDADAKDPGTNIVMFYQSGLGLGEREYYFDKTEAGQKILGQYRDYITQLLSLSGEQNAAQQSQAIIALETKLAKHQWTKEDDRDAAKTYNKYSLAELKKLMPGFPWEVYFATLKIPAQEQVIVMEPSYFAQLTKLASSIKLDAWKAYFRFQLLDTYANYMGKDFVDAKFNFRQKQLAGQAENSPRWKRAVDSLNGSLGELLGKLYVEREFPPAAKARMLHLVDNLKTAYGESINNLDWMSADTKQAALAKLAQFTTKIGYPDKWRDYSALEVFPDQLLRNIRNTQAFDVAYMLDKLGKPVDRSEWGMSPQTVNAYYNPVMNEIVFPAAILQPPFFDMSADDAVNYGAIGAVIGHEIGHGFDDQGAKYDGEGKLRDWWTSEDLSKFEGRTGKLVAQYNKFSPLPNQFVNGQFTLGENIGDLGGLSIALKAYQLSLMGKPGPVIDGFSGEQRVFMGWAQVWRSKATAETTARLLKIDPHSPAIYRVNGVVPNIDAFYQAFDVQPGDAMYLPPEERVKIW